MENLVNFMEKLPLVITENPQNENLLIVGCSGSGKTRKLQEIIPEYFQLGEPLCVVDIKGEIAKTTFQLAEDAGYKVVRIDFSSKSIPWNPFSQTNDMGLLAELLLEPDEPFYFFYIKKLLLEAILLYIRDNKEDIVNLPLEFDGLIELLSSLPPEHAAHKIFSKISDCNKIALHSAYHFVMQELKKLSWYNFQDTPIPDAKYIYLLHDTQVKERGYMLRIFVGLFIKKLQEENSRAMIVLDELDYLRPFSELEKLMLSCQTNIRIVATIQFLSLLETVTNCYSPVLNLFGKKIFMGISDIKTVKYLNDKLNTDWETEVYPQN